MTTRRDFIKKGSLAGFIGLSAGVFGNLRARGNAPLRLFNPRSEGLSMKMFEPHIGSTFGVFDEQNPLLGDLKLVGVKELSYRKNSIRKIETDSFSLLFKQTSGDFLNQKMYIFNHDQVYDFEAFLVPVSFDEGFYELNFNNLRR